MKKIVSALLALLLILGGLPVSAESSQTAVEIPCEYVIENRIHHVSVAGIVDNGLAYVSLETAAELSGTTMLEEGEFCHFISERLWNLWSLELSSGTLTEESVYYDKRSWEIPTLSVDGDTLVSLEHMLCAMGCRYSWNAGEEYPLSIYKPYTYFDALHEVNKESVFFEWAELGSAGGNEKLYYMLSAFYSLIMDYNSHLISDVLFSWIADDILNAPEEQWRDAMYTVLTCLEGADLGSVNSEAIESLELEGDGLSLGLDTLKLMGISGGELEKIGGALEITDFLSIPLKTLDAYLTFRKVNEGQVDMLKAVFLTERSGSYLDEGVAARLRPVAQNLQNLIEGDAEAWTSDAAVAFATKIATMTVDKVVPIFAILDATTTLVKLLPPTAELVEANQYINLGISCDAQSKLVRAELLSLKDEIRSRNGNLQSIEDSQKILAYALRASYAARKCFLEAGTLDDSITAGLQERNQALLTMILKVETAEAVLPADNLKVFINWEEAAAGYAVPQYGGGSSAAGDIKYEQREEVIEFRLSDGTLWYYNKITYPYFLGNSDAETKINRKYAAVIEECRNNTTDFDALYQDMLRWNPNGVNGIPFYDNIFAEVTYCNNGVISIKERSTMWSGGMHPYSDYVGYTYSIADGSELSLREMIAGSDEEIYSLINQHKQSANFLRAEVIMESPYVLTNEGLCFICNVGDAVERAEVVIPYSNPNTYVISAGGNTPSLPQKTSEVWDIKQWKMPSAQAEAYAQVIRDAEKRFESVDIFMGERAVYATLVNINGQVLLWTSGIAVREPGTEAPSDAPFGDNYMAVYSEEIWEWDGAKAVEFDILSQYGANANLWPNGFEVFTFYRGTDADGNEWNAFYPLNQGRICKTPVWYHCWGWIYGFKLDGLDVVGKNQEQTAELFFRSMQEQNKWPHFPFDWSTLEITQSISEKEFCAEVHGGNGYESFYHERLKENEYGYWPESTSEVLQCAAYIKKQDGSWIEAGDAVKLLEGYARSSS